MSQAEDHLHLHMHGRSGTRARRSLDFAGKNPDNPSKATRRGGWFNIGRGGRTVLPPLDLPFRPSRSPSLSFRSHFRRGHELITLHLQRQTRRSVLISTHNDRTPLQVIQITMSLMINHKGLLIQVRTIIAGLV